MKKLMIILLCITSVAVLAQSFPQRSTEPQRLDPNEEKARLGWPTGNWEGFVQPLYNPVGLNSDQPGGYKILITIREQSAQVAFIETDGRPHQAFDETYIYNVDNTVLLSGVNRNGAFVEYQSIALAQIEPDEMNGYLSRFVHNIVLPTGSRERMMAMYGDVKLHRVN